MPEALAFFLTDEDSVKMFSAQNKIKKDKNAAPTECEEQVAQALFDLENTNQELKSELKDLYINQAVYVYYIFVFYSSRLH